MASLRGLAFLRMCAWGPSIVSNGHRKGKKERETDESNGEREGEESRKGKRRGPGEGNSECLEEREEERGRRERERVGSATDKQEREPNTQPHCILGPA